MDFQHLLAYTQFWGRAINAGLYVDHQPILKQYSNIEFTMQD